MPHQPRTQPISRATPLLSLVSLSVALLAPATSAQSIEPPAQAAAPSAAGASRYQTGMALLNRNLNDSAEKELRAFLEEQPRSKDAPNARYALAIALSRLGRFDDASAELAKVVSLADFAFAPDATLLLAQCVSRQGDDARAADLLANFAQRFKTFQHLDEAAALLGECLNRLGRHDDVVAALHDFDARWPSSKAGPRAALLCAMSEASLGKHADAAARAESLIARDPKGPYASRAALVAARARDASGDARKARELYESAASGTDDSIKAEALLAVARHARADTDVKAASRALDRFDALPGAARPPSFTAWATYERARLALDAGDADAALSLLAPLADGKGPRGDSELLEAAAYWSARCESALGRFNDASTRLAHLAKAFPKGALAAETLFDRASAAAKAGKPADAAALYQLFLDSFASHAWAPDAAIGLATSQLSTGDNANAARICERVLASKPRPEAARSLTWLLAESRFASKQYDAASLAYDEFLKLAPDDADAWRAGVRRGLCSLRLNGKDARDVLARALAAKGNVDPTLQACSLAELADACAAAEDWQRSVAAYESLVALRADPPDPQDLFRLGVSLRKLGRSKDSIAPLTKAASIAASVPGSTGTADAARLELAQALLEQNDAAGAEAAIAPLVSDTTPPTTDAARSARSTALRLLASIESTSAEPAKAAEHLAAARALGGDAAPEMLIDEGLMRMNAGDLPGAEHALTAFMQHNTGHPRRVECAARLAIVLSRQGKHAEAIDAMSSIKRDALAPDLREAAGFEMAMSLLALAKRDAALAELRSLASGASPGAVRVAAAVELARLSLEDGDAAGALAVLDALPSAAPKGDNASLLARSVYYRAAALLRLDRPRDAASLLRNEAARFTSTDIASEAALLTADALARSAQPDDARATLASLLESKPSPAIRSAALLLLGDVAASSQRWSDSEKAYATFLDQFADSDVWFRARFGLAQALEAQGKHAAAIDEYRKVVARHSGPTAARAQFQIGECLIALGKHDEAITELIKVDAAYAEPEWSAAALFEAGRALLMLNRPDDATRQFDEVVSRFPDSNWAAMAKDQRAKLAPAALPGRRNAAAIPTGDR